jgi:WD40 repeat protein
LKRKKYHISRFIYLWPSIIKVILIIVIIVWDLRSYKKALAIFEHLANDFEETGCDFSPDGHYVVTGTSGRKTECSNSLMVINTKTLETIHQQNILDEFTNSVVRTVWHSKINQIILSCADGSVRVLFDNELSVKGAKLCADKAVRSSYDRMELTSAIQPVMPPTSGQVTERSLKRKAEKARLDPIKSRRPELPVVGHGRGGRVGSSFTAHLMKNIIKDTSREEDPREALLRYAQVAEAQPIWVAPAYQRTQPKPVFSEECEDEEGEVNNEGPSKGSSNSTLSIHGLERDRILRQTPTSSSSTPLYRKKG